MKNLKEYIVEGIFDVDDNIDNVDDSVRRDQIKRFLKDKFDGASSCKISDKPNKDGKYEVSSSKDIKAKNKKITSLTNGMFIWTEVGGRFYCYDCELLKSLEGAPEKVGGTFDCNNCSSLTSLEGAPKTVGESFNCCNCKSLTSLKGAPKEIGGDFYCCNCKSLTSLKGAPKEVGGNFSCWSCKSLTSLKGVPEKVNGHFECGFCISLTSLEGAPKEVGNDFYCSDCRIAFTTDDVKKVSNVKGKIKV